MPIYHMVLTFTARCTIVQGAVLRSHIVCLSVRLSVRPSVMLVDCDHIGSKSWKLIGLTISPTASLFVAQTAIHLLPGEHEEMLGRLEMGRGKSGVLEHKSGNISGTRKDAGKVTDEENVFWSLLLIIFVTLKLQHCCISV